MASRLYDRLYAQAQVELAKILQGEERSIIRLYGTALYDIRKILKDLYDKYSVEGKLTNGEMSKYNRLANVQDQICRILQKNMKQVDSLTKRLTAEQYSEAFYRHAYAIDQVGGMALNWGLIPEEAVEAAMKSPFSKLSSSKALKASREGTVDRIRQEIGLSVIRGDSYDVLANRISAVLGVSPKGTGAAFNGKGAAYRSLMVARTEGQRILVEGQEAASRKARELGCTIRTIWDATLDGRTRPAHAALDGKPKDDPEKGWFVPEIGYVTAPLHSGVAAFDINCRCRERDEVVGFPPDERYVRGDGIKPYQTYGEWKEQVIRDYYRLDTVASDGLKATEMSMHLSQRMMERGITKDQIIDALKNPLHIDRSKEFREDKPGRNYIGKDVTVSVNPHTGTVATVHRTSKQRRKKYGEKE